MVFLIHIPVIPLRHLEIMITISLKFSSLCSVSILWLLSSNFSPGFPLLCGLLKCVSMGFGLLSSSYIKPPIGFIVFPPSFMEIQLLLIHWLMKFLIIHVYHELDSLHSLLTGDLVGYCSTSTNPSFKNLKLELMWWWLGTIIVGIEYKHSVSGRRKTLSIFLPFLEHRSIFATTY